MIIQAFQSFTNISSFNTKQKKLQRFVLFCISLIFTCCLFLKKMVTTEIVKMYDKMRISAYILKIVEKDPFLRLQMRAKEDFNSHQFFSRNKQYVKIKLMHHKTNRWNIFW